jgi:Domain of unknown function (DUF4112)
MRGLPGKPMEQQLAEPRLIRSFESPAVARNMERVAWLMDRAIRIPGTKITLGLDALLGLFPFGGDVLTGIVQVGLVLVALKHYRVPKEIAARMMGNVLLDVAVGAIPLLGDLFDIAFKANTRNLKLLEPYRHRGDGGVIRYIPIEGAGQAAAQRHPPAIELRLNRTLWRYLLPIAAILVVALVLMTIGLVTLLRWLF